MTEERIVIAEPKLVCGTEASVEAFYDIFTGVVTGAVPL
jgi:hypothetical protein